MPPKQPDVAKYNISPVLFMTVDGEPMSFFLRPGAVKRKLQPLITAGAGMLCNVQKPGSILLIDPEERGSIPESSAHWYISTQYIHDCVEKNEQLNLEDYRLNPEVVPRQSARLNNKKETSPGLSGGRVAYTAEDDAAILNHVSKHRTEIGGNRLWQEMERQRVTSHSWQSMKYRYRVRLAKKLSKVVVEATTEEDTKAAVGETEVEGNQVTDVQKSSSAEDAASAQTHPVETDVTKIDGQSILPESTQVEAGTSFPPQEEVQHVNPHTDKPPTESKQVEAVEDEPSFPPQEEVQHVNPQADKSPTESKQVEAVEDEPSFPPQEEMQHVNPQADKPPTESRQVEAVEGEPSFPPQEEVQHVNCQTDEEAETSNTTVPEGQTDAHPIPAKNEESETEEPQTVISPQKESMQEDSPPAPPEPMPSTSHQKKPREKLKASPEPEQLQRRSTRRKLVVELLSLPEPYVKKLRSSTTSPVRPSSSPRPSKKTKSDVTSVLQKDSTADQPPSKRARETSVTESQEEQSGQAVVSEITQADTESNSTPQKGEKKKEKRKLGILELATKEFEDESESDEEGAPDLQNPTETATTQPTSTELPLSSSDTAADRQTSAQSNPDAAGPSLQEKMQETPANGDCLPQTGDPESAATEPAASKAHLFIFDSESQEEESQSVSASSKPLLTVNKDAVLSLTQVQLEEDMRRIKELMKETNQDLASVTKALLRTSGHFSAARDQLLNPSSISGPFWNRYDDSLLHSADPVVRQQLQEKYSEEEVAKRIMFLEVV